MKKLIVPLVIFASLFTGITLRAQFAEGFNMDMNRRDKVKEVTVGDVFVLPLPTETVKPDACPGCSSVFLYDEQEVIMALGKGRLARRVLISPLKDVTSQWLSPGVRYMGGAFQVSARVLMANGSTFLLDENSVKKTTGPQGVHFQLTIPNLSSGDVIQFEVAQDFGFRGSNRGGKLGDLLNQVVVFGDGQSPVVRSQFRLTHPKGVSVNVFTRPSKGWQKVNLGRLYDDLSTTESYQHEFFAPRKKLPMTPANASLAPCLVVHVQSAEFSAYFEKEQAGSWQEILKTKSDDWNNFFKRQNMPRELSSMTLNGDTVAKANALRQKVMELSAKKPQKAPLWFLAAASERLGGRMVYPASGPGWLDKSQVANASLDFPLMAFDGFQGAFYVNPMDLSKPAALVPDGLGGDWGVSLDASGSPKWVRFSGTKLANTVALKFSGSWQADGAMSGILAVTSPTGMETALANLGNTPAERLATLKNRQAGRGSSFQFKAGSKEKFSVQGTWGMGADGYLMAKPLLFSALPPMDVLKPKRPFGVEWEKQQTINETVTLGLPAGFDLASPFPPLSRESEDLVYSLEVNVTDGKLIIKRKLEMKTDTVPFERYEGLYKDLAYIYQMETMVDIMLHRP